MTHLGQSTEITTVQDKDIVLTSTTGQPFRMKVADLAEAIRQVMPVVSMTNNGLMSKDYSQIYIPDPANGAARYYKIGSVSNIFEGFKLMVVSKETGAKKGGIYFVSVSGTDVPSIVLGKILTIDSDEYGSHSLYYMPNGRKSDIYIGSFTSALSILVLSPGTTNKVDISTQLVSLPDGAIKLE